MIGNQLNHELQLTKGEILILGSRVEQAVRDSVAALKDHDFEKSKMILENDKAINSKRFQIERLVIGIIAAQHPDGHDLRMLTSMLALASELERIGDYAKGIATINLRSGGLRLTGLLRDVYEISLKSVDMLQHALTAFELEDPETARSTIGDDTLVDSLYNQLYTEVMGSAEDDPENVERLNYVLWVGHNLERIADRATNICERVIFIATGKLEEETSHQDMLFAHQIQNA